MKQREWMIFGQGRTTSELSIFILVCIALLSGVSGIWIGLIANIPMLMALVVASILVWRTSMKHKVTRIALFVIVALIGVSAVQGGVALLQGALDQWVQVSWLAGTPFSDYTIPGLVLVIVVGGTGLLAAATVFIQREWAVLISVLAGLLMAGYEVVEIISIDSKVGDALPTALGLQLVYFVFALVVFGLAGFIWMRDYRYQHFHPRRVSHA